MENSAKKKRKDEVHQVMIETNNHQGHTYPIAQTNNAYFPIDPYP
jgi:hypothetical protein